MPRKGLTGSYIGRAAKARFPSGSIKRKKLTAREASVRALKTGVEASLAKNKAGRQMGRAKLSRSLENVRRGVGLPATFRDAAGTVRSMTPKVAKAAFGGAARSLARVLRTRKKK